MISDNNSLVMKTLEAGLIPININYVDVNNKLQIPCDSVDDFIKFAKTTDSRHVFYYYDYHNIEDYLIPLDDYGDYPKEFIEEINFYNHKNQTIDFNQPYSIEIFVITNGVYIGSVIDDFWLEELEIDTAEEKIQDIESKFTTTLKKIKNSKKAQIKNDENELREIIFKDPEFTHCKNQQLRYNYLIDLIERDDDLNKFKYLISPYGAPHIGKIKFFMDETWRLFRENNKMI